MSWELAVTLLLGILLLVAAGRIRQRSLGRSRDAVRRAAERRGRLEHDPRLSPIQETQGTGFGFPQTAGPEEEHARATRTQRGAGPRDVVDDERRIR